MNHVNQVPFSPEVLNDPIEGPQRFEVPLESDYDGSLRRMRGSAERRHFHATSKELGQTVVDVARARQDGSPSRRRKRRKKGRVLVMTIAASSQGASH